MSKSEIVGLALLGWGIINSILSLILFIRRNRKGKGQEIQ
jgi:hypothetical protein